MPDAALVIEDKETIDSFELALLNPVGGKPPPGCTWQELGLILLGDLLTFDGGAKSPKLGRHSKYLRAKCWSDLERREWVLVPLSIDGTVVLASGFVQLNANPFALGELSRTDVPDVTHFAALAWFYDNSVAQFVIDVGGGRKTRVRTIWNQSAEQVRTVSF